MNKYKVSVPTTSANTDHSASESVGYLTDNSRNEPATDSGLASATGVIDYTLMNDYMFRAVLQRNEKVLKALIGSLLHMKYESITSITITNPIKLGEEIEDKDFILDISLTMNDDTFLNLEMQIAPQFYWNDRSLSYLCRSFDQLQAGAEYKSVRPAIHIGFLDFTPFRDYPEFYATYMLLNVKTHYVYSDKFILKVVNLTQIDLATEEDRFYRIDHWARLFKAKTWEELKMAAKNDQYLQEACEALYSMNADNTIRAQCRARADYEFWERCTNQKIKDLTTERDAATAERDAATAERDTAIVKNEVLTAERNAAAAERDAATAERNAATKQLEKALKLLADHGIVFP
jgi:predicted transposase/invertase (TIGR01784 family)